MFFNFNEIFDMIVMVGVVGFIFMNMFKAPKKHDDLQAYLKKSKFNWDNFWFAAMVTAPAIILHEFGHKFVAMAFGLSAEFNAAYMWLGIALVIRLLNFPFLFFVPAFVSISGGAGAAEYTLIAVAGPLVNLILFIIATIVLKTKKLSIKEIHFWGLTKKINLFLCIFNLIPIPGFDGYHVLNGLIRMF